MRSNIFILGLLSMLFFACNSKKPESPYIFLPKEKASGFTSAADFKTIEKGSYQEILWEAFMAQNGKIK